jgi:hypothetical protein
MADNTEVENKTNEGDFIEEENQDSKGFSDLFFLGALSAAQLVAANHPNARRQKIFLDWESEFMKTARRDERFYPKRNEGETRTEYKVRKKSAAEEFKKYQGTLSEVAYELRTTQRDGLFTNNEAVTEHMQDLLATHPEITEGNLEEIVDKARQKATAGLSEKHEKLMKHSYFKKNLGEIRAGEEASLIFDGYLKNVGQRQNQKLEVSGDLLKHRAVIEKIMARHLLAGKTEDFMNSVWTDYASVRETPKTVKEKMTKKVKGVSEAEKREFSHLKKSLSRNRPLNIILEQRKNTNTGTTTTNESTKTAPLPSQQPIRKSEREERQTVNVEEIKGFTARIRQYTTQFKNSFSQVKSFLSNARPVFSKIGSLAENGLGKGINLLTNLFGKASKGASSASRAASALANAGKQLVTKVATKNPYFIAGIVILVVVVVVFLVMSGINSSSSVTTPYHSVANTSGSEEPIGTDSATITEQLTTTPSAPTPTPNLSYLTPGENLEEIMTMSAENTCTPKAMIKAISRREAYGVWKYDSADFDFYNSFAWWQSSAINEAVEEDKKKVCRGYSYNTCTNVIAQDAKFASDYCGKGIVSICRSGLDVMGPMQFELGTWKGYIALVSKVLTELSVNREPDRRVILDAFLAAGFKLSASSKAESCTDWTPQEIKKAAKSYYGSCTYSTKKKEGNYCQEVCNYYNLYSDVKVDCGEI